MIMHWISNAKWSQNELNFVICIVILIIILFTVVQNKKRSYLPGPYGLPIVGYLPFMTKTPHLKFIELGKRYGDIFSISLGSKPLVVLNNADHIREAFSKPEFLGRPPYIIFSLFKKQSPFFTSPVHVWQEQRKFVVNSLKDLGVGKSTIEEHINDEVSSFIEVLKSYDEKPIDLLIPLNPSVTSNIFALLFGFRFTMKDPLWKYINKNNMIVVHFVQQTTIFLILPWARYIPFLNRTFRKAAAAFHNVEQIFKDSIKKHKETLNPSNIRDYVDKYLIKLQTMKENSSNTTFNEEILKDSTTDLFGAGSETVRTSILWCVYIAAAYPDIQKKIQKEIVEVVGSNRMAEYLDHKSMPYTQAFIMEVQRWVSVLPLNVFRCTTADTNIGKYKIPRNTAVVANFWAVHRDPKYWNDPDNFKPERFLDRNRKTVVKPMNYMPFSLGKRVCPGEAMAYMEMFLYLVSMLQRFDIAFPDGYKPTFESVPNLTLKPKAYEVKFVRRAH